MEDRLVGGTAVRLEELVAVGDAEVDRAVVATPDDELQMLREQDRI